MFGFFEKTKVDKLIPEVCTIINTNISSANMDKNSLPEKIKYDPYFFGFIAGTMGWMYMSTHNKQGDEQLLYSGDIEILKLYFPDSLRSAIDKLVLDESKQDLVKKGLADARDDLNRFNNDEFDINLSLAKYLKNRNKLSITK
jgi:hypothetical protein